MGTMYQLTWIGYLFRATSGGIMRVAGLAPVEGIDGLENIDVTKLVNGHMAYRAAMPRLLREVGWVVTSDEFIEIEDPDPDNHEKRQRELIREIDEARNEAKTQPEKRRFGFFKRGKLAEKKGWETYDERAKGDDFDKNVADGGTGNVLFDVEAIRAELASEQIEVKQLESTLPPMKLNLDGASSSHRNEQNPRLSMRESKSYDESIAFRLKTDPHNSRSLAHVRSSNSFDQAHDENNDHSESESYRASIEQVKISFDQPQRLPSPALPSQPSPSLFPDRCWPSPPKSSKTPGKSHPGPASFANLASSVEPMSSITASANSTAPNLAHNAWLDEDDEDFGKEKEVTMSFA